jgi:hypothetical protein
VASVRAWSCHHPFKINFASGGLEPADDDVRAAQHPAGHVRNRIGQRVQPTHHADHTRQRLRLDLPHLPGHGASVRTGCAPARGSTSWPPGRCLPRSVRPPAAQRTRSCRTRPPQSPRSTVYPRARIWGRYAVPQARRRVLELGDIHDGHEHEPGQPIQFGYRIG